jgi:hypothetical protein
LALFIYDVSSCLVIALEQESKFVLNLELGESYIYGKAFTSDNSYSINIQQASSNLIVLPSDFVHIKESREALVSFGLSGHSDTNKIFVRSDVKIGRGDLIEVYLSQDTDLFTLSNHLPLEMTLRMAQPRLTVSDHISTSEDQLLLILSEIDSKEKVHKDGK